MAQVKIKVINGTFFEGRRYVAGEEYEVDEKQAKALGDQVEIIKDKKSKSKKKS